jgi:AraC-like DNA-binding protein
VNLWDVRYDLEADRPLHRATPGFGHALLATLIVDVFRVLGVSATLQDNRGGWTRLHVEPNLIPFEVEHGADPQREAYNATCLAEVRRRKKAVRGQHSGYSDLFVPIIARGQIAAILVTGPFASARPTSHDVLERWRGLTGRQGHPADPEFASYLATTLATLVLDGDRPAVFEQLIGCLARLLSGEGAADALANEAERLRKRLEPCRAAEHMWEQVRTMVDDRSQRGWASTDRAWYLRELGLSRLPDRVLVGLAVRRARGFDPVDDLVGRDAFQRSVAELARATGNVVAGRIGSHGVLVLSANKKQRMADLAQRISALGDRRFGLSLHFGSSATSKTLPLSRSYHAALAGAERALSQGSRLVTADAAVDGSTQSLRQIREDLCRAVEEAPDSLGARFERYLETVEARCGYRFDRVQGHLEAGFELMARPLVAKGLLDPKSFSALCETLDHAGGEAKTASELFIAYRSAVADMSEAVARPVPAKRERSLRAALYYIHQHYTEPLRFQTVARLAGFAPNYFSALFKEREGMPFERYVAGLRIERAKQWLASSELPAARVAELSGFSSPQYFSKVFRQAVGATPVAYRLKADRYLAGHKHNVIKA